MPPFSPAPRRREHRTRRTGRARRNSVTAFEHPFDESGYSGAMDLSLQGSLLDLTDAMTLRDVGTGLTRHHLTRGAWVDVRPGWLAAGGGVFPALLGDVPWHAERRQMYASVVDVPRLTKFYAGDETLPRPILVEAREALRRHYPAELGEPV